MAAAKTETNEPVHSQLVEQDGATYPIDVLRSAWLRWHSRWTTLPNPRPTRSPFKAHARSCAGRPTLNPTFVAAAAAAMAAPGIAADPADALLTVNTACPDRMACGHSTLPIVNPDLARVLLRLRERDREMTSLGRSSTRGWSRYVSLIVAMWASGVSAPGATPVFSSIIRGSGQEYANAVTSDASGNTYVGGLTYSPDFPVTPGAVQTTFGGTSDAFVAKLAPDGKLVWATYLGGLLDDAVTGIAIDAAGNVVVTGYTHSMNFPVTSNALQKLLNNTSAITGDFDAFVAKIDPTGTKLLYSTYLGSSMRDQASAGALDASGNLYITGETQDASTFPAMPAGATGAGIFVSKLNSQGALVYSFFRSGGTATAIAIDSAGNAYVSGSTGELVLTGLAPVATQQALIFKLSADGTTELYDRLFGGSGSSSANTVAVDSSGAAYVGGATSSADFPLVKALQTSLGARPLWKSSDAGNTWSPNDNLPFAFPQMVVPDPTSPNILYVTTYDEGIFRSTDSGNTWTQINHGIASPHLQVLAIDPAHPQTLYVGSAAGTLYKTVDAGANWSAVDSVSQSSIVEIAVDTQNAGTVYVLWNSGLRKSADGGTTWSNLVFPAPAMSQFALDPHVSGRIFAYSPLTGGGGFNGNDFMNPYLWRSNDSGVTWTMITSQQPAGAPFLVVDGSTNPSTVYNGLISRSIDGGVNWTPVSALPVSGANANLAALAVNPAGTLYASVFNIGIYQSGDHGQTWAMIGNPTSPANLGGGSPTVVSIAPDSTNGTVFVLVRNFQTSGFVTKFSPDGSSVVFSTYLGGHVSFATFVQVAAEPTSIVLQTEVNAIALDAKGNLVVTGGTRAGDFATANPLQATNAGGADIFVANLTADGSKLNYSTYYGGSKDESALAIALDSQGNAIVAGQTWSGDFPVPGGPPLPYTFGDAFAVKLAIPGAPVISTVLNGASYQPGIEAGSWVMIQGSNLADTNPGRTWTSSEAANGVLPTSLDGVSVTIDGKAAFVYYISPTQINVQAPSDAATGPVNVVVNNNGAASAPATAQLQPVAPAFFMTPGTNFVIASHLPDYTLVGTPSAPAKRGDTIVLWGTGFGPTTPSVAAGIAVTDTPFVVNAPTVTVGGTQVPVLNTLLTAGSAGLYQITIQLPANLPTGTLAIQSATGNTQSAPGVSVVVQ